MIKNKEPVETTIVHRLVFIYTRYSVLKVLETHPYYSHQSAFVGLNRGFVRDCRGGAAVAVRQWSGKGPAELRKARPAFRRGTPRESSRCSNSAKAICKL